MEGKEWYMERKGREGMGRDGMENGRDGMGRDWEEKGRDRDGEGKGMGSGREGKIGMESER